jgi:hypothetical protein
VDVLSEPLLDVLGEAIDRPFGAGVVAANLRNFSAYRAKTEGLANLLRKAVRRLADGDVVRAEAFIHRVIALTEEGEDPPWGHAHMLLYGAICDAIDDSDEHDSSWLDRAMTVMPELRGFAELELTYALQGMTQEYRLLKKEYGRIRAVVGDSQPGQTMDRMISNGEISMLDAMRQILTVVMLYERPAAS